jgi:hypothetical protein
MIAFLICVVCACTLIGALRGYRKHRYGMNANANAVFVGALDGLIIGIVVAAIIFCLWQVFQWWATLFLLGLIFWPKRKVQT